MSIVFRKIQVDYKWRRAPKELCSIGVEGRYRSEREKEVK